ncbi:hypothetical protein TTRE_0000459801 [Trichuris trichiura]|uniref:Uncharacterized protein n=1 Tax=Trichuris trichiura TaxID=36087 RepID=A0A077Z7X9_TRITR|nr:hypothetical protein TTRE_0000459801 [Trichuris trichiura]
MLMICHSVEPLERSLHDIMDPIRHLDKRDFQEHNPVRSEREMFERYDPWVGITIGISLGTMLGLMLANVAVRWITKRLKRLMRKTKLGRRIFGDELSKNQKISHS